MPNTIGAASRKQNRNRQLDKLKEISANIFDAHFVTPNIIIKEDNFAQQWDQVITRLSEILGKLKDYKYAYNCAVNKAISYIEIHQLNTDIPSYLVTQKAQKTLRTKEWLSKAWAFNASYIEWFKNLSHQQLNNPEELYKSLILSFICHSGHCCVFRFIRSLISELSDHLKSLFSLKLIFTLSDRIDPVFS